MAEKDQKPVKIEAIEMEYSDLNQQLWKLERRNDEDVAIQELIEIAAREADVPLNM